MSLPEIPSILLKISETVSKQSEEIELLKADLHTLAKSTSSNITKIKQRLDLAEKALTEEHPEIISKRFEKIEEKLEEIFYRLNKTSENLAELREKIREIEEKDKEEEKYRKALEKLTGNPKLSPEILNDLEKGI